MELREKLQQHYLSIAGFAENLRNQKKFLKVQKVEDYFVIKARKTIEANLSDFDFNVETLCKELNLSHSQVHRKLSALTGFSANKFIRYIRLNKAKELLQDPKTSILAVALDSVDLMILIILDECSEKNLERHQPSGVRNMLCRKVKMGNFPSKLPFRITQNNFRKT